MVAFVFVDQIVCGLSRGAQNNAADVVANIRDYIPTAVDASPSHHGGASSFTTGAQKSTSGYQWI